MSSKTYVTKPLVPNPAEYLETVANILASGQLTNNGPYLKLLEERLKCKLGLKNIIATANGTDALMLAIAASVRGTKILTTPFTYAATVNAIKFLNLEPVFADIDEDNLCLSANSASKFIKEVDAILTVQVYGNSGNIDELYNLAKQYQIPLIVDGSHSFGCKDKNGDSLYDHGDICTASFHATKTFSTIEGGAVITSNDYYAKQLKLLRNFGYNDKGQILAAGVNSKMSEIHAAFGLHALEQIDRAIESRRRLFDYYVEQLFTLDAVKVVKPDNSIHNYTYVPTLIDRPSNWLTETMRQFNEQDIFPRRYFHPLLSNLEIYKDLDSAQAANLPVANRITDQVLCLPIFPEMPFSKIDEICEILRENL